MEMQVMIIPQTSIAIAETCEEKHEPKLPDARQDHPTPKRTTPMMPTTIPTKTRQSKAQATDTNALAPGFPAISIFFHSSENLCSINIPKKF